MRLVLVILASCGGLMVVAAAVVSIVGAALPERHEATRSIILPAAPADVYRVIADQQNAPAWRKDLTRVEMLGASGGRKQFREHGTNGTVTYEVVEDVPGQRLVTRIVDRDLGYSGSWTYVITRREGGSVLTITENGQVSNVLFRFMSRFVFGHTKSIDSYLASLSRYMNAS
jgi:uncharacterized protein YndB with AHSA1/START domain